MKQGETVKMEPMTVDRIKKNVAWALRIHRESEHVDYKHVLSLAVGILEWAYTWAHERAMVLELEHRINWHSGEKCDEDEPPDWVAYVLEEIGWKE